MISIAQLAGDLLGQTATVVSGLAATASDPASLSISLAAGSIYQLADIDATTDGAISQNTTQILQQGIVGAQTITLETTSLAAGQSQWQLIEAQFSQSDVIRSGDPNGGLLYFYNSTTPTSPFEGPNGDGATTPTERKGLVTIQVITGSPATTGSETPPTPSEGWTPLYLVDLSYGQTTIIQSEIHQAGPSVGTGVPDNYQAAPFLAGLTNSHHGGVAGQAPQIKLASEVQGTLPMANLLASDTYGEIAAMQNYAGNPNGHVAGNAANGATPPSLCWDTTDKVLWVCTTTGTSATAVWANVDAASVGASSLGDNGYKKYADSSSPTGWTIEQWGQWTEPGNGAQQQAVTFPLTFPNACLSVVVTLNNSTLDIGTIAVYQTVSSGFSFGENFIGDQSGLVSFFWRAIGY